MRHQVCNLLSLKCAIITSSNQLNSTLGMSNCTGINFQQPGNLSQANVESTINNYHLPKLEEYSKKEERDSETKLEKETK